MNFVVNSKSGAYTNLSMTLTKTLYRQKTYAVLSRNTNKM